jgi:hypothetical protein
MPTPTFSSDDKARHKTTKTRPAEQGNQIKAHPPPAFMKKEDIGLKRGGKTLGG